jgi:hypothetical protein
VNSLSLSGPVVGLSISESQDLEGLGLGEIHVRQVFVEMVRHLLAGGCTIGYGGDLRAGGYTETLFDLIRAYDRSEKPDPDRVRSYFARPVWEKLKAGDMAALRPITTVVRVPSAGPEDGLPDALWRARCFTDMRERMTSEITVRILLGGRVSGQVGFVPGVVEEAVLALRSGKALFCCGGFGGAGRVVIRAMAGDPPPELSIEYQLGHGPNYADLVAEGSKHGLVPDFAAVGETLASAGWPELANGLGPEENRRLASTDDVDELVALVLRGLRRLSSP